MIRRSKEVPLRTASTSKMTCFADHPSSNFQAAPPRSLLQPTTIPTYHQHNTLAIMKAYWYDNIEVSSSSSTTRPSIHLTTPHHTGRPTPPPRLRPPSHPLRPLQTRHNLPQLPLSRRRKRTRILSQLQEPRRSHNLPHHPPKLRGKSKGLFPRTSSRR